MEWIEESQIEQNGSMEQASDKLRSDMKKCLAKDVDLIVHDGDKFARVRQDTPVPQYYKLATHNQKPMTTEGLI